MTSQNTCKWLIIGSTELCQKSSLWDFCQVHRARLRKSTGTKPCTVCGVGVKNKYLLCMNCGYAKALQRDWARGRRAFQKEFERLATIEIPY